MEEDMRQPTLIVFVDALAFDYLEKRPFLPGFWNAELPLETLIGYSSSIVPSIWSGLYPDQMNSWNEFFYGPRLPYRLPRLLDLAPHPYLRGFLRRVLFRYGPRLGWYSESLPGIPASVEHLFSRKEVRYWQLPPVPLGEAGLNTRLDRAGIPYHFWFNSHGFKAANALTDLESAMTNSEVLIYGTATIDGDGHIFGPNPQRFDADLAEIEKFILGGTKLLSQHGEPNVVVISDHGMTEVTERINLIEVLKPWELGRDYVVFLDSTMARFWDVGLIPLDQIVTRLEQTDLGRFLTHSDQMRYGLNFNDNRYGDVILLLNPGYLFSPSFMEMPYVPFVSTEVQGMHGYAPDESSTRGVFLYHGSSPLSGKPSSVVDVISALEELLELQKVEGRLWA